MCASEFHPDAELSTAKRTFHGGSVFTPPARDRSTVQPTHGHLGTGWIQVDLEWCLTFFAEITPSSVHPMY